MAHKTTFVIEVWTKDELDKVHDPILVGRLAAGRDNGCASMGLIVSQESTLLTNEESKKFLEDLGIENPNDWA